MPVSALPTTRVEVFPSGSEFILTFDTGAGRFTAYLTPAELRSAWEAIGVVLQSEEVK